MRYSIRGLTAGLVKANGGRDIRETRVAVFATLTPEQAEKLRHLGGVVEAVQSVRPSIETPLPLAGVPLWSPVDLLYAAGINELRGMLSPPIYGNGMNVAVVGTGIRATHELLGGRVVYQRNYTADPHADDFDHETGVASILVAMAPLANLLDIKVIDSRGVGTEEAVVEAIDDLISMQEEGAEFAPHVINLSLGAEDTGDADTPLRAVCREAIARGMYVFAAAGNSSTEPGAVMSPAVERYVFAVGSVDPVVVNERIKGFTVSDFSARGPTVEGLVKPDAIFFGRNVIVASGENDTGTVAKSGTSFACPFAAGALTLYLEGERIWGGGLAETPAWLVPSSVPYPMTPEDLIDVFMPLICVKPAGVPTGKDNDYGWGMPYGPLVLERMGLKMASYLALITPVLTLGMVGMMMGSLARAMK